MGILQALKIKPYSTIVEDENIQSNVLNKLENRDYSFVENSLSSASDIQRYKFIWHASSLDNSVNVADAWIQENKKSIYAKILLGASMIQDAWKIRGGKYAEHVKNEAWEPFFEKLESALEPLKNAASMNEKSPDPFPWLITAGMGLDMSKAEVKSFFLDAMSRNHLHFPSHSCFFLTLTERWGGSQTEVFNFARERVRLAPQGSLLHILIAMAFSEYVTALNIEEDFSGVDSALKNKDCQNEIIGAFYKLLDAKPDNLSIKLKEFRKNNDSYGLNLFGAVMYLCGAKREAKAILSELNGKILKEPWNGIGSSIKEIMKPGFVYDRACKDLGINPAHFNN